MDVEDVDDLSQFMFDAPPLSDLAEDVNHNDNSGGGEDSAEEQDAPNAESELKPVVRRRARKACVACHKRYARRVGIMSSTAKAPGVLQCWLRTICSGTDFTA